MWMKLDPDLKKILLAKGIDFGIVLGGVSILAVTAFTVLGAINPLGALQAHLEKSGAFTYWEQMKDKFQEFRT